MEIGTLMCLRNQTEPQNFKEINILRISFSNNIKHITYKCDLCKISSFESFVNFMDHYAKNHRYFLFYKSNNWGLMSLYRYDFANPKVSQKNYPDSKYYSDRPAKALIYYSCNSELRFKCNLCEEHDFFHLEEVFKHFARFHAYSFDFDSKWIEMILNIDDENFYKRDLIENEIKNNQSFKRTEFDKKYDDRLPRSFEMSYNDISQNFDKALSNDTYNKRQYGFEHDQNRGDSFANKRESGYSTQIHEFEEPYSQDRFLPKRLKEKEDNRNTILEENMQSDRFSKNNVFSQNYNPVSEGFSYEAEVNNTHRKMFGRPASPKILEESPSEIFSNFSKRTNIHQSLEERERSSENVFRSQDLEVLRDSEVASRSQNNLIRGSDYSIKNDYHGFSKNLKTRETTRLEGQDSLNDHHQPSFGSFLINSNIIDHQPIKHSITRTFENSTRTETNEIKRKGLFSSENQFFSFPENITKTPTESDIEFKTNFSSKRHSHEIFENLNVSRNSSDNFPSFSKDINERREIQKTHLNPYSGIRRQISDKKSNPFLSDGEGFNEDHINPYKNKNNQIDRSLKLNDSSVEENEEFSRSLKKLRKKYDTEPFPEEDDVIRLLLISFKGLDRFQYRCLLCANKYENVQQFLSHIKDGHDRFCKPQDDNIIKFYLYSDDVRMWGASLHIKRKMADKALDLRKRKKFELSEGLNSYNVKLPKKIQFKGDWIELAVVIVNMKSLTVQYRCDMCSMSEFTISNFLLHVMNNHPNNLSYVIHEGAQTGELILGGNVRDFFLNKLMTKKEGRSEYRRRPSVNFNRFLAMKRKLKRLKMELQTKKETNI